MLWIYLKPFKGVSIMDVDITIDVYEYSLYVSFEHLCIVDHEAIFIRYNLSDDFVRESDLGCIRWHRL